MDKASASGAEIPGSSPGRVRICSAISKFLLPWKDDGYKLLPSHICLCFSCLLLLPPYMRLLFCCLLLFCVPPSLSLVLRSVFFFSFRPSFFTYTLSNASPLNVFGCRIYSKRTDIIKFSSVRNCTMSGTCLWHAFWRQWLP